MLSHAQIQQFKIDGYLILPGLLAHEEVTQLKILTEQHLTERVEPFELEVDVNYPGAPKGREMIGGETIRRLRMAYQRAPLYATLAERKQIITAIHQILGGNALHLNPNHHNCVMTKLPRFSSETHWHRDTRYWNFNNKYLINAWFAIGEERYANGGMKILPGSHRWEVRRAALDDAQFLIPKHEDNRDRLHTQRLVELSAGDVLLFSAHCFHAAGKNTTQSSKYSVVFTYHNEQTHALKDSNSDKHRPITLNIGL